MNQSTVKKTQVVKIGKDVKYDVYIGRRFKVKYYDLPESIWANPFKHDGTEENIDRSLRYYEAYVRSSPELMYALPELEGKILGCWCKPKRCHGDVLVKLLEERRLADFFAKRNFIRMKYGVGPKPWTDTNDVPDCGMPLSEDANIEYPKKEEFPEWR